MPIVDVAEKSTQLADALRDRRRTVLAPPLRMPLDEWADTYRVLPSEASSMPGPWRTSSVEVARGPFRAVTEIGVDTITGVASAQIFKTSLCETLIGRFMHLEPAPMLIFEPTGTTADAFDTGKLEPMVKATPALREIYGGYEGLARKHESFLKHKKSFPGGYVEVLTADSVSNLAMRSAKIVMLDEVDKKRATRDGDPIALAEERLKRFRPSALSVRVSTPTITGESRIMQEYEASDQRRPYVRCPHCEEWHVLEWERVSWEKGEAGKPRPETARYFCRGCGTAWSEADRVYAMTTPGAISWRQTRRFECCGETQDPDVERLWVFEDRQQAPTAVQYPVGYAVCKHCGNEAVSARHAGFWAWEIYNPVTPVTDTVSSFLASRGDRSQLQNFVNSKLARAFAREVEAHAVVDPDHLAARTEPPWPGVPAGVRLLTCGIDVQGDRLEIEIVGWGEGDESWSLDYQVLPGDPRKDDVWRALDEILSTPLPGEDGRQHYIQATAIDTGYLPDEVCAFVQPRQSRMRVRAIKSMNEAAGSRSPLWPARSSSIKKGAQIYRIGSQAGKDRVSSHMGVPTPGPGYMHIPANRDRRWFEQLTAERLVRVSMPGGREGTMWQPKTKGKRNEAVDCRVYALAALQMLRQSGIAGKAAPAPGTAAPQPASTAPAARPSTTKPVKAKRRAGLGGASIWG